MECARPHSCLNWKICTGFSHGAPVTMEFSEWLLRKSHKASKQSSSEVSKTLRDLLVTLHQQDGAGEGGGAAMFRFKRVENILVPKSSSSIFSLLLPWRQTLLLFAGSILNCEESSLSFTYFVPEFNS